HATTSMLMLSTHMTGAESIGVQTSSPGSTGDPAVMEPSSDVVPRRGWRSQLRHRPPFPGEGLERRSCQEAHDVRPAPIGGASTPILSHQHDRHAGKGQLEPACDLTTSAVAAQNMGLDHHNGERHPLFANERGFELHISPLRVGCLARTSYP